MMNEDYRLSAEERDSLRNLDLNGVAEIVPAESVLGKELGMTQKELAASVGCERTYINRIEKGETDMPLSSFLRLADALGVNLRLEFSPAH